ncbi:ABC transporter permease [Tengunoibacter tsumagoiensis]|uniref:HAMP domain-containing protein n=1 Tax=Tengunoibacter tsumagoiensis TaxID=2014871 RepID=A0A401ZXE5_9CHLR|nr:ABC transporter permease [Tengunoibacter tsumagoiensis]GCE11512.1 hypothetical protein KTT_13710 [Tengunoibacter tsumagoiensis]
MQNFEQSITPREQDVWSEKVLPRRQEVEAEHPGWLNWWFRFTMPKTPTAHASLEKREAYRRARLVSWMLLLLVAFSAPSIVVSLLHPSTFALVLFGSIAFFVGLTLILNRLGLLAVAGCIIVGLYTVGMAISYLALPHGVDISNVIGYDMLLIGLLLAVAFFPPWSVFPIALFNSAFIYLDYSYERHTPQVDQFIAQHGFSIGIERSIGLQIIAAIVLYLWSSSANRALRRADRAEVIARLQHDLAEKDRDAALQKERLDYSIQTIVEVLTHYSNGDSNARIPLTQDNTLWHIGGAINNLLGRVQRLRTLEAEVEKARQLQHYARQLERDNAALRANQANPSSGPLSR